MAEQEPQHGDGAGDEPAELIHYGRDPSQFVERWAPASGAGGTAVLIHGGYWRDRYGLDLMHPMARHLVTEGWTVINIEYRRLGEPPEADGLAETHHRYRGPAWPEMSADVVTAVATATDGPGPMVAIGHSAGGHLALWAASVVEQIDAVVALAPVADLIEADRLSLSGGVVRQLLGGDHRDQPDRYHRSSPRALLPLRVPQLIVHGDGDDNVPPAMAHDYADAAEASGDPVDRLFPADVDHFHIIDPGHPVWRPIDEWLAAVARQS